MRTIAMLAVLMTLTVTAAAGELHDKMIGVWKIDLDKLEELMVAEAEAQGEDPAHIKQMIPMMKNMFAQMRVTITEDAMTMKMMNPMSGEQQVKQATYTVVSEEGDVITLDVTQMEEGEAGNTERGKARFEGDTMVIENEGSPAMPMIRAEG